MAGSGLLDDLDLASDEALEGEADTFLRLEAAEDLRRLALCSSISRSRCFSTLANFLACKVHFES